MRALRGLWRETIWHPSAIPATEGSTSREMKRFVLPAFDILVIIMGFNAVTSGMPSFNIVYDGDVASFAAWTLLCSGIVALVGVSFPRLWALEAAGKLAMLAVFGGYAAALWVAFFQGSGARAFVAAGLTGLIALPLWNLARLGRERTVRLLRRDQGGK